MDELKKKKMELGRRAAYLRRCVQVHALLEQYEGPTSIRKRVFELHIQPVMNCSYTTFNNMLNEPNPARQLEALEVQREELKQPFNQ